MPTGGILGAAMGGMVGGGIGATAGGRGGGISKVELQTGSWKHCPAPLLQFQTQWQAAPAGHGRLANANRITANASLTSSSSKNVSWLRIWLLPATVESRCVYYLIPDMRRH